MAVKRVLGICIFFIFLGASTVSGQTRCTSHCDQKGFYQKAFYCTTAAAEYCCGDKHERFCCGNATMDISGDYNDVYVCPRTSWWLYHWQIVIGLLGSIIVILLFAACCCQCCGGCKKGRATFRRSGRVNDGEDVNTVSGGLGEDGNDLRTQHFDPESPFAFTPPSYDSLPKDPPKYEEIWVEGGSDNTAFAWDAPPPESARTNGDTSSSSNQTPRSQSGVQIATHGLPPIGELPPYEVAVLEPSSSQTVSSRNATNSNAQPSSSTAEVVNVAETRLSVRYQPRANEQNTNPSSSSDHRL